MRLEVLDRGESIAWVRLEGRLDLKGVEQIELLYTVKAGRAGKPVVVDLRGVAFVGSLAIGMFVSAARTLGMAGHRTVFLGATEHVEEVLRIAGVDQVAALAATEDEARQAAGAA